MLLKTQRVPRTRSGAAAVEFAFVIPVLLLLMLGVWEFGRLIEAQQIISNAAREGARLASTGNYTASAVDTAIKNYMSNAGLNTTGYTTRVYNLSTNPSPALNSPSDDPSAATQMQHLRVQVTLPVNNVKWLIANKILSNKTNLFGSSDWYCMRDQPLTVDSSMPSS
jgi:Flp pilus assembly protein TadG